MNCKVCGNTSTKNISVSFFRFPKESKKCRDWAERCGLLDLYEKRGNLTFYKSFRICSDHFDSKDIVFDGRKKRLLQSAIPQILIQKNQKAETQDNINKFGNDEVYKLNLVKNMCRLCAAENRNLTDIYGWRGRDLNLGSKLKYFPMMINKYDVLPLKMCHQCITKVNQFHDFIMSCLKAETKLRIMLGLQGCNKSLKTTNPSPESQGKTAWELEMEKSLNETPNCSPKEVQDLPNPGTHFLGNVEDNYEKVLDVNFLHKDGTGCLCKQPQPICAKTNQLIDHTNFIKEVDFSMNINYVSIEHDYSNVVSRDQLLLEPEIQIENDQNFMKETKHTCDICLESFCSIEVLNAHSLTHSVQSELTREFICETCNKAFFSRFEFDEHISEHDEKYVCKICDKKFHKVAFFEKHSLLHQLENSCDCFSDLRPSKIYPESDEKSVAKLDQNKSSLFNQKNSKLGKISFNGRNQERRFCKKLFKNQICLTHETSRTDTPHQCKQCGKTFRSRPSLRQHGSVHSDKRLYNCQECGMSFKRKDTLSNHLRIHTGERPFVCKVCGFAFKQRGDCIKHEKNHQKTREAELNEGGQTCNVSAVGSSTDLVDVSEINDGSLWDDEKNSSLFSYMSTTGEITSAGSLEDMVAGRISFNF